MGVLVRRLERPGALVSRSESHQLRSGYVVLEPGEEVGRHQTGAGEELIVVLEGIGEVVANGHSRRVRAPSVVLVPAQTVHNVRNRSETTLRYVYVVLVGEDQDQR